jgi:hypothetical protein
MSRPLRAVLAASATLALLAGPATASAEDPCTDPDTGELVLEEQQVYLRQAETKVGNLGATEATGFPSWSEEAPSQSVTGGAGGGYLTPYTMNAGREETDFTFVGDFSGCLDTMLIELYAFLPTSRTGTSGELNESDFWGYMELYIDGVAMLWGPELQTKTVPNPEGDATYRIRFAITDIHTAMGFEGMEPDGDHELKVRISPRYANTSHALFVYDTTDVPAGVLFNGVPDDSYATVSAG